MWNYEAPLAMATADYTASGTSVVIPAGSMSGNIMLTVVEDFVQEDDEVVTVSIDALTGAVRGYPDVVTGSLSSRDPKVTHGDGVTDVAADSVRLNCVLETGDDAVVTLYWGLDDGGTNSGNWEHRVEFGSVAEDVPLWVALSGLRQARTYYYRCHAVNDSNLAEDWSDVTAFRTVTEGMFLLIR